MLFCIQNPFYAQKSKIDSLISLSKTTSNQKQLAKLYDDISWEYIYIDPEKSKEYILKYKELNKKVNLDEGEFTFLSRMGNYFEVKSFNDSAIVMYNKCLKLNYVANNTNAKFKMLNNLGNVYSRMGRYEESIKNFHNLLKESKILHDTNKIVISLINLSSAYENKGITSNASNFLIDAYKLSNKVDGKPHMGVITVNLCSKMSEKFDCETGEEYCKLALIYNKENPEYLATAYNSYGLCSSTKGDHMIGKKYLLKGLELSKNPYTRFHSYLNLGAITDKNGKIDSAILLTKLALKEVKNLGFTAEEASANSALSKFYFQKNDVLNGIKFAKESIQQFKYLNSQSYQYLNVLKNYIYNTSKLNINVESELLINYIALQDSLLDMSKFTRMEELIKKYDTERKDHENRALKNDRLEKEKKINTQNLIIGGSVIILIFVSFLSMLLYRQRNKQKSLNNQLSHSRDQIATLNRELNHRVKNNLAFMSSLLQMQGRRTENAETKQLINESDSRLKTLALVHTHLFKNETDTDINIKPYLQDIIDSLTSYFDIPGKTMHVKNDIGELLVPAEDAMRLGLIINESITNSVKHAFHDVNNPEIHIRTFTDDNGRLVLDYKDNGPGRQLTVSSAGKQDNSLGTKLIELLCKQLGDSYVVYVNKK